MRIFDVRMGRRGREEAGADALLSCDLFCRVRRRRAVGESCVKFVKQDLLLPPPDSIESEIAAAALTLTESSHLRSHSDALSANSTNGEIKCCRRC